MYNELRINAIIVYNQKTNFMEKQPVFITVEATIHAPVEKVWEFWTSPEHITKWNSASEDWHTPWSRNDLQIGGRFSSRMEAKDGSFGFEFGGTYDDLKINERIAYTMDDGRTVRVDFSMNGEATRVVEVFQAEGQNPVEMQQGGWQAILNNFKKYTEAN